MPVRRRIWGDLSAGTATPPVCWSGCW